MDADTVDTSNLHRQIVHSEHAAEQGWSKVRSAIEGCRRVNSEVEYVGYEMRATAGELVRVLEEGEWDVVCDCTDNPAARYAVSDACVVAGRTVVSGAAQRGEGSLVVLNSPPSPRRLGGQEGKDGNGTVVEKGPCYRCVFPRPPPPEMVRGCSEIGILGPVVGVIGTLMAAEVIRIVSQGRHRPLLYGVDGNGIGDGDERSKKGGQSQQQPQPHPQHTMLLHNMYATDPRGRWRTITLKGRRKECIACGDEDVLDTKGLSRITRDEVLKGRVDYIAFCGAPGDDDVAVLDEKQRIGAEEFLGMVSGAGAGAGEGGGSGEVKGKRKKRRVVVDVREEHEFELGAKVSGSINIPISRILRHGGGGDVFDVLHHPPPASPTTTTTTTMRDPTSDTPDTSPESVDDNYQDQDDIGNTFTSEETCVYFVCQRGNDSQIAAQKLMEQLQKDEVGCDVKGDRSGISDHSRTQDWGWIGDVKGGFVALERYAAGAAASK
jgi:adenylyltransferase/sulfurtransferase